MSNGSESRESLVFLAKLAEQSERFEGNLRADWDNWSLTTPLIFATLRHDGVHEKSCHPVRRTGRG